jgi:polar amino acid transport system substrate-binding protein
MKRAASMLTLMLALWISFGISHANAQQSTDPRVADLIRSGKLRAGVGVVAPHWAVKDQATGQLRGVAVDIAQALADRLGVQLMMVEYPSPPAVLEGLKIGAWDVGFLAFDSSRAEVVDFSPPYLEIDATYLVQGNSPIHSIAEADQPGIRIAVTRKSVEEIVLTKMVRRAELQSVDTIPVGVELLRAGNADALALPRPAALQFSAKLPGSRVLADRFFTTSGAIAVPKGQASRLAYISEFVEQAKASGLVKEAIEHVGVRGVQVAPVGNPNAR